MNSPRFQFPIPSGQPIAAAVPGCPFVMVPVAGLMPPAQAEAVRQVYQIAWERTQAVLAPTKVDFAYRVSAN